MKKLIPSLLFLFLSTFILINAVYSDENIPVAKSEMSSNIELLENQFGPSIWMCDRRIVLDGGDYLGRTSGQDETLVERINNYGFEGEQIKWKVLVMDLDGIDDIDDVYLATKKIEVAPYNGPYDKSISCEKIEGINEILPSCNARIGDEMITNFNPDYMSYYSCNYIIPDFEEIYGYNWITVEVTDKEDLSSDMDENEYWYFNPIVSISVDTDSINFDNLKNRETFYSNNITIRNSADPDSGVLIDMFISGTDFYDNENTYSYCDGFNKLSLSRIKYFASKPNYDTIGATYSDEEGYRRINKADSFSSSFYSSNDIIPKDPRGPYFFGNILYPSEEMVLNFKIDIPDRCKGKFNSGSIYIWGEAI